MPVISFNFIRVYNQKDFITAFQFGIKSFFSNYDEAEKLLTKDYTEITELLRDLVNIVNLLKRKLRNDF
jgi:hypothetical protein